VTAGSLGREFDEIAEDAVAKGMVGNLAQRWF
jgi:hypothetical protein